MKRDDQPKIKVIVRKRPLLKKQLNKKEQDIVRVDGRQTIVVSQLKQKVDLTKYIEEHAFNFDRAYDQSANNDLIYLECIRPIIQVAFLGARVTCFAYGQTGSGKTFTMNGDYEHKIAGLYALAGHDIFSLVSSKEYSHLSIGISFFQIYCGKLFDLLNDRQQLQPRQDNKHNVNIVGLSQKKIFNLQSFMQIIHYGSTVRITAANATNSDSSRSHAILQIYLKQGSKVFGKISFIDLAGCQRGADNFQMGKQTKNDGSQINKSLLALKECIRALDQGKTHTPFRQSKLTMVLKDSFVGFSKTVMICNISPGHSACENSLNTLRYADRVKELKKAGDEQLTRQDQLARELMLPRLAKNTNVIIFDKDIEQEEKHQLFKKLDNKEKKVQKKSKLDEALERAALGDKHFNKEYQRNPQPDRFKEMQQFDRPKVIEPSTLPINRQLLQKKKKHNNLMMQVSQATEAVANTLNIMRESGTRMQRQNGEGRESVNMRVSQSWQDIIEMYRSWRPRSQEQIMIMSENNEFLINKILAEEDQIVELHRTSITSTIQSTKRQMQLVKLTESEVFSAEYLDRVISIATERIRSMNELKVKGMGLKRRLEEQAFCERKLKEANNLLFGRQQVQEQMLLKDLQDDLFTQQNTLFR